MFKIARVGLHHYEEPVISGKKGSGTVFFCGCTLKCVFCQNYEISRGEKGIEISDGELVDLFFYLKEKGAHNINLVSPSLYVSLLPNTLKKAKEQGLDIPFVYNTSAYESVESLKKLEGLVDVYLPDYKYADDSLAWRLSRAKNYDDIAYKAISEMKRQQPKNVVKCSLIKKGVIIRHLVLPGEAENTKEVFKRIASIGKDSVVSVMAQYFPVPAVSGTSIDRRLTQDEYDDAIDAFFDAGLKSGYMQELGSATEEYVPDFDLDELQAVLDDCRSKR